MSANTLNKNKTQLAICFGLSFFAFTLFARNNEQGSEGHRDLIRAGSSSSLADGCHHVFIDGGSNRGVHGRFLFEPEKYPESTFARLFDEVFGPDRKNQDICVFAFEPNPLHAARQTEIAESYQKKGWRYHYLPYAIMDQVGELTFYRNTNEEQGKDPNEEWGFSANNWRKSTSANKLVVQGVDFSAWLTKNVFSRSLPTKSSKVNHGSPTVMMKMDIEGAEWSVIPKLVTDGVICKFDKLVGEMHPLGDAGLVHANLMQRYADSGYGLANKGKDERERFSQSLNDILSASGCAIFEDFDDESYLHDGAALPL